MKSHVNVVAQIRFERNRGGFAIKRPIAVALESFVICVQTS